LNAPSREKVLFSASGYPPPGHESVARAAEKRHRADGGAYHVWLVEDSATDAFVIGEVLKECRLDHELNVMRDGDTALRNLRDAEANDEVPPDLLLLDLNIPKAPGIKVLSFVRNSRRLARVPVIVVTSSDSPEDLAAIEKGGATAYFKKPRTLDKFMDLCAVIDRALGDPGQG
jgi:two-component system, chemotaxis family, response regulator Rcp1